MDEIYDTFMGSEIYSSSCHHINMTLPVQCPAGEAPMLFLNVTQSARRIRSHFELIKFG